MNFFNQPQNGCAQIVVQSLAEDLFGEKGTATIAGPALTGGNFFCSTL